MRNTSRAVCVLSADQLQLAQAHGSFIHCGRGPVLLQSPVPILIVLHLLFSGVCSLVLAARVLAEQKRYLALGCGDAAAAAIKHNELFWQL